MTQLSDKERMLQVWLDAVEGSIDFIVCSYYWVEWDSGRRVTRLHSTSQDAWADAASKLPTPSTEQGESQRVAVKPEDSATAKAYVQGINDGLESAAKVLEGGSFISTESPIYREAHRIAKLIRDRKTIPEPEHAVPPTAPPEGIAQAFARGYSLAVECYYKGEPKPGAPPYEVPKENR